MDKMTLEELLNKLLERGWKPFGKEYTSVCVLNEENIILRFAIRLSGPDNKSCLETMRTITAKESGLWQFVCENGMVENNGVAYVIDDFTTTEYEHWTQKQYQYRLIESALKDESELEDFLLSNIKVDEL